MDRAKIEQILSHVEYLDWQFHVGDITDTRWYLQVVFVAPNAVDPHRVETQRGRKWYLNPHMTTSEIVQTALAAVLAAVEHEAREQFTYKARAVFGPHFDVERLVLLADDAAALDPRPRPRTGVLQI